VGNYSEEIGQEFDQKVQSFWDGHFDLDRNLISNFNLSEMDILILTQKSNHWNHSGLEFLDLKFKNCLSLKLGAGAIFGGLGINQWDYLDLSLFEFILRQLLHMHGNWYLKFHWMYMYSYGTWYAIVTGCLCYYIIYKMLLLRLFRRVLWLVSFVFYY